MSIRTHIFPCKISVELADKLNHESGRIYTDVMVEHWRIWRKKGIWLGCHTAQRLNDFYNELPSLLTAHSIDAAQEGFYKACGTTKAVRRAGVSTRYPFKRKHYRTTTWKNTGIRLRGNKLRLSLASGQDPIMVSLPSNLLDVSKDMFKEMRLVYDKAKRGYRWHLVVNDGLDPADPPGNGAAAIDMGEIHPATVTDGEHAAVITCRELRSVKQYREKKLAALQSKQSSLRKGSGRWRKIQSRKNRFLAKQKNRTRDMEHKISRDVVNWCVEHSIGELAIGDVRDIADGKRLNRKSQQKVSNWSHGKIRRYIGYKAKDVGIVVVDDVDESYTSQTCPACGRRNKPRGRNYRCSCGFTGHRDAVGSVNILSKYIYGELGKIQPPKPKYRLPHDVRKRSVTGTDLSGLGVVAQATPRIYTVLPWECHIIERETEKQSAILF